MEVNASFLINLGVTLDLKKKKKGGGEKEKDNSPDLMSNYSLI